MGTFTLRLPTPPCSRPLRWRYAAGGSHRWVAIARRPPPASPCCTKHWTSKFFDHPFPSRFLTLSLVDMYNVIHYIWEHQIGGRPEASG